MSEVRKWYIGVYGGEAQARTCSPHPNEVIRDREGDTFVLSRDHIAREAELKEGVAKHWQVVCGQRAKIDALQASLTAADEANDTLSAAYVAAGEREHALRLRVHLLGEVLRTSLLSMKRIYQAGYDRIIEAGGTCDTPEYMIENDPTARELRALLNAGISASVAAPLDYGSLDPAQRLAVCRGDAATPVAVVPDGYCIMPRQLTAENGAKALLLGEFKLLVTEECPECCELEEPAEGCSICDGEGEYGQKHTIPWDKIKFIYSKAVEGLAVEDETNKSR